jgi:CAI-1 autoinducer synthase
MAQATLRPCYPWACEHSPALSPRLLERVRRYGEREAAWQGRFILDGKRPASTDIRLDGNDYLNLTGHPHIIAKQMQALQAQESSGQFVVQSGAFVGALHPSRVLEKRFAELLGKEDVHLSQSGYSANLALLQVVCGEGDAAYIDMLAHASLWEGVHAARVEPTAFLHNDPRSLEKMISRKGPGVVIIDSVYSGNGAIAPLKRFVEICEANECMLVVDESHSLGLYGPKGAGLVAELGLTERVHFITASLAKAFAARAGLFTAPASLRGFIYSQSYPSVFSSCLLPPEVAGLDGTMDLILEADERRARLHHLARELRAILTRHRFPVANGAEQIFALEAGTEHDTMLLRDAFDSHGIIGAIFCSPAATISRSFLRFTPHAGVTDEDLQRIDAAAEVISQQMQPWTWASARRQKQGA